MVEANVSSISQAPKVEAAASKTNAANNTVSVLLAVHEAVSQATKATSGQQAAAAQTPRQGRLSGGGSALWKAAEANAGSMDTEQGIVEGVGGLSALERYQGELKAEEKRLDELQTKMKQWEASDDNGQVQAAAVEMQIINGQINQSEASLRGAEQTQINEPEMDVQASAGLGAAFARAFESIGQTSNR